MATFSDLDLIPPLRKAIDEEGYVTPTPIQEQTIPPALEGLDICGSAQTGTGKTAAFALPILNRFGLAKTKPVSRRPAGLVLAPTRELAIQIGDCFNSYGRHLNVRHTLIFGGVGQGRQVHAINKGVHILIATPGRLLDLMGQELVFLNRLEVFVVDEADRMMDMGFLPDLKRIIKTLPVRRQTLFFSATMPKKIVDLSKNMLHDPVRVDVAPTQTNVELIDQRIIFADHRQKKPLLVKLIRDEGVSQAVVFTKTKRGANSVCEYLRKHDLTSAALHGNKSQNARQQTLGDFRSNKFQVLVATDVAARGIDVDGISHVFNFELPIEPDSYVHRIGRTGRAGEKGVAISLCSSDERHYLRRIEKLIGFELLPDGREPEPLTEEERKASVNDGTGSSSRPRTRRQRQPRRRSRPHSRSASGEQSSSDAKPTARKKKGRRRRTDTDRSENTKQTSDRSEQGQNRPQRPTAADRKQARKRRRQKPKTSVDRSS